MAKGLTEKQRKILEFIIDFQKEHGFPPTIRELGDAFQIGSLRGVTVHLDALARKNFITRERTSRSIRVITEDPREQVVQSGETGKQLPLVRAFVTTTNSEPGAEKIGMEGLVERYVSVPDEIGSPATENGFVIRVGATGVKGEPILPGDLLVVRPQRTAYGGELVVTFSHGDMSVGRAGNNDLLDTRIPSSPEIIGRVVGLIRRY